MYLIAPATIIFIGAEMHIDPALLSRRRSLERSWEAAASLAAAIYTKTLQNYRRTISNFCAVRPTVFDRDVLAFDVARFLQPFANAVTRKADGSGNPG